MAITVTVSPLCCYKVIHIYKHTNTGFVTDIRTDGWTDGRTDGQVENIMPPPAGLAWRRHNKKRSGTGKGHETVFRIECLVMSQL